MIAHATALLAAATLSGGAAACEAMELFGLRLGEPVPAPLVLSKDAPSAMGIVHITFKARTAQPPLEPLEADATGRLHLLTGISGSHRQETAAAGKQLLQATLDQLSARHRCRFREDRAYLRAYPRFDVADSEAHVSIGSGSVVVAQRDGGRVVVRSWATGLAEIIRRDPPQD